MAKGKSLKTTLARVQANEAHKKKMAQKLKAQADMKQNKLKSMKSGKSSGKKTIHSAKAFIPFDTKDKILLVGEGDFSFARSIVEQNLVEGPNIIATAYDSRDVLDKKYPNCASNIEYLEKNGCKVSYEIDATKLVQSLNLKKKKSATNTTTNFNVVGTTTLPIIQINMIIFNFPHTGHGIKDQDRNIREHQILMKSFFHSCDEFFKEIANIYEKNHNLSDYFKDESKNSIIVSLFDGEPYRSWAIKSLAKSANYLLERSGDFEWEIFKGYHHCRTNSTKETTKPAATRNARFYKFTLNGAKKKEKSEPVDSD